MCAYTQILVFSLNKDEKKMHSTCLDERMHIVPETISPSHPTPLPHFCLSTRPVEARHLIETASFRLYTIRNPHFVVVFRDDNGSGLGQVDRRFDP
jgi:hypothetical protein